MTNEIPAPKSAKPITSGTQTFENAVKKLIAIKTYAEQLYNKAYHLSIDVSLKKDVMIREEEYKRGYLDGVQRMYDYIMKVL